MAYRGDLIACEVDFDGATNGTFPVVFSLNGREVARASMKRRAKDLDPFPFIAMGYEGIRVLAKVCLIACPIILLTLSISSRPSCINSLKQLLAISACTFS